jgi:two-component system, sensor histidine kinase
LGTDDSSNKSELSTPTGILDRSALLSFVDGDETLLQAVCALFLGSCSPLISAMGDAIAQNDGDALARSAHTLRGSGAFFLTESARKTLTDLELAGRSGDLTSAPAQLVSFGAEMERLRPELSALAAETPQSEE